MSDLRTQIIKLAHANPEMREHLLPLLKQAEAEDARSLTAGAFEDAVKGKKFVHPKTHNQVQFKSLPAEEQARIRGQWQQEAAKKKPQGKPNPSLDKPTPKSNGPKPKGLHVRNVLTPMYQGEFANQAKEVVDKYGIKDKDVDDFADWRRGKPQGQRAMNWEKLKAAYLQHAKPETKKRMMNMSSAEFKAMYLSVVHKDDNEGME